MSSPISAPKITSITDLPTLSDLYASKDLPEPQDEPLFPYDSSINKRVSIWRGDITKLRADMIVNAANRSLLGGGGVDGAIHRAAGRELYRECEGLNGACTGETKVTMAYDLPSTRIAHTVGPVYSSRHVEECEDLLASCYQTSLEACASHGGGSIGFSSISTGVYGYPIVDATRIALDVTREFLDKDTSVTRVVFVVFSKRDEEVYQGLVPEYFPGSSGAVKAGDSEGGKITVVLTGATSGSSEKESTAAADSQAGGLEDATAGGRAKADNGSAIQPSAAQPKNGEVQEETRADGDV